MHSTPYVHLFARDSVSLLTITYLQWSGSQHLTKTATGFEGTVKIPWGLKTPYKYIVDGNWTTTVQQPTEYDSAGNLNNVFYAPARPTAPAPSPKPAPSTPPTAGLGGLNGIFNNAKNAAVAMVEALAPGTAETPEPTPAIGTDSRKEEILGTAAAAQEKVVEPVTEAVKATAEAVESKVTPAAKPEVAPTEAAVETPKEVTAEHVLPVALEAAPIAAVVPVPVLPLTVEPAVAEKAPETEVVPGAATSETKQEPSTHTPASAPTPAVEPSTHTPAANGSVPAASEAPASPSPVADGVHNGPSTHSPVVLPARKSDAATPPPITNGVNGTSVEKAAEVLLPAPTPSEAPASAPTELPAPPATPKKANGTPTETPSTTSSPANSPRKEKKGAFPTFGRHHRQSSSASISTNSSSPNTANELGVLESPSRKGTMKKKRTSSLFGKVKNIFSDESKKEKKSKEASS